MPVSQEVQQQVLGHLVGIIACCLPYNVKSSHVVFHLVRLPILLPKTADPRASHATMRMQQMALHTDAAMKLFVWYAHLAKDG